MNQAEFAEWLAQEVSEQRMSERQRQDLLEQRQRFYELIPPLLGANSFVQPADDFQGWQAFGPRGQVYLLTELLYSSKVSFTLIGCVAGSFLFGSTISELVRTSQENEPGRMLYFEDFKAEPFES